ncbi:MAG: hypothetical protein ACTSSB_11310 [Candidatus Heimdallarchaeota archaeon]
MKLDNFLLLFLKDNPSKIPSIKFWCLTIFLIDAGIEVEMPDGHILTIEDCFKELEDITNENQIFISYF